MSLQRGGLVMAEKSKPIEIIGVDNETVEKDGTFPEAYAFYIKLSDNPDTLWEKYLLEWDKALYSMQREMRVIGDKLRVVFVYGDDIQNCVKYAKQLVRIINERVKEHNKKVELQEKKELAKQELSHKKEDEIREKLRGL
jgi:hypothetical protein